MIDFIITCDSLLMSLNLWLLWEFITWHLNLYLETVGSEDRHPSSRYIDFVHWMTFVEINRLVFLLDVISYIFLVLFLLWKQQLTWCLCTDIANDDRNDDIPISLGRTPTVPRRGSGIVDLPPITCPFNFLSGVWRCLGGISSAFAFLEFLSWSWVFSEEHSTELS